MLDLSLGLLGRGCSGKVVLNLVDNRIAETLKTLFTGGVWFGGEGKEKKAKAK